MLSHETSYNVSTAQDPAAEIHLDPGLKCTMLYYLACPGSQATAVPARESVYYLCFSRTGKVNNRDDDVDDIGIIETVLMPNIAGSREQKPAAAGGVCVCIAIQSPRAFTLKYCFKVLNVPSLPWFIPRGKEFLKTARRSTHPLDQSQEDPRGN